MIATWNSNYQVRLHIRSQYFSIADAYSWEVAVSAPGHLYCLWKYYILLSYIIIVCNCLTAFVKIYDVLIN